MRISSLVMLLLTGLLGLQSLADTTPAPGFDLPGRPGPVSLESYRGKVLWLDFWASWCGPCRQSFPWMNAMRLKYADKGLAVLAINLDQEPREAERFLQQYEAGFDIAFDVAGQTPERYGVSGMPSAFLIDREGRIISRHVGFRHDSSNAYENQLRAALGLPQLSSGEPE